MHVPRKINCQGNWFFLKIWCFTYGFSPRRLRYSDATGEDSNLRRIRHLQEIARLNGNAAGGDGVNSTILIDFDRSRVSQHRKMSFHQSLPGSIIDIQAAILNENSKKREQPQQKGQKISSAKVGTAKTSVVVGRRAGKNERGVWKYWKYEKVRSFCFKCSIYKEATLMPLHRSIWRKKG